jgi:hypothetical protein
MAARTIDHRCFIYILLINTRRTTIYNQGVAGICLQILKT